MSNTHKYLLTLITAIIIFSTDTIYASTKYEYYKNVLQEISIKATYTSPTDNYDTDTLIFLSEYKLENKSIKELAQKVNTLVVVCDNQETIILKDFSCNSSEITNYSNLVSISNQDSIELKFIDTMLSNTHLIVLPQYYLISMQHRNLLANYFEAKDVSDVVSTATSKTNTNRSYSSIIYVFISVITLTIFVLFLYELEQNKTHIKKRLENFFSLYYKTNLYVFLYLLTPLPIALGYIIYKFRDNKTDYIISVLLDAFVIGKNNLGATINTTLIIGALSYISLFLFSLSWICIKPLRSFIKQLHNQSRVHDLNSIAGEVIFFVCICVSIAIQAFIDKGNHGYIAVFFLCLGILIRFFITKPLKLSKYFIPIAIVLVLSSFIKQRSIQNYTYIPLLDNNIKFAFLPVKIQTDDNIKYQDFIIDDSFSVFVNNYLAVHPNFNKVVNTSIENFDASTNYYITAPNITTLANAMARNKSLIPILTVPTQDIANYETYTAVELTNVHATTYQMKLTIECVKPHEGMEVSLRIYNKASAEKNKQYSNLELYDLAGCAAGDKQATLLPLPTSYLTNDMNILQILPSKESNTLNGIKASTVILSDNKEIPSYTLHANNRIYAQKLDAKSSNTVFVYMIDDSPQLTIEKQAATYNLSELINSQLINRKPTEIEIWSPQHNALFIAR